MQIESIGREELARQQKLVEQINENWRKRFEQYGNDVGLRKWCIEHAQIGNMTAEQVLRFLTEPIAEMLASPSEE